MARRGENIYKRKDGRWEARCIVEYKSGKAVYKSLYGKSYSEVKAKKQDFIAKASYQTFQKSKQISTFNDLAYEWLHYKKMCIKETTYALYHRIIHKYLLRFWNKFLLVKIDKQQIINFAQNQLFIAGLRKRNLCKKTVSDILRVFKSIFYYGKANGFPCIDITFLHLSHKSVKSNKILSEEALIKVTSWIKQIDKIDFERISIVLPVYTGIRIGEACGLKWGDIDLKNKLLHINRTVQRITNLKSTLNKTEVVIKDTKTASSIRTIPLPDKLLNFLKKIKKDDDIFILSGKKKPVEPNLVYVRYKRYMAKEGLKCGDYHSLRHTFATQCIENNADPKTISELLGHASVSTTLALYVHPSMNRKRSIIEKLYTNM